MRKNSPVPMDDGNEAKSIPPGGGEVLDIDARVFVGGVSGPAEQSLLGGKVLGLTSHNVRNLQEKKYIRQQSSTVLGDVKIL